MGCHAFSTGDYSAACHILKETNTKRGISMAAPASEERKLIELCKNYIVACGVLCGIQYENIASMQDAIKKIADAYKVDLTVGRAG